MVVCRGVRHLSEEFDISTRTNELIRAIALIPALGFLLAFCREISYFLSLGIDVRYVVSLQDIIRESALSIWWPALFFLLCSWYTISEPIPEPISIIGGKYKNFFTITPVGAHFLSLSLVVVPYILLGVFPEFSIPFCYVLAISLVGKIFLVRLLEQVLGDYSIFIWMMLLFMSAIAGLGASEAYKVRSGMRDNLPILSSSTYLEVSDRTTFVLRSFSSGLLVGTSHQEKIWFLNSSAGAMIEFETNPEPFRGLLCYSFDWCWLSGWAHRPPTGE